VGQAIGAPICSNLVASAESSGASRRAGVFSPIVISSHPKSDQATHMLVVIQNESKQYAHR